MEQQSLPGASTALTMGIISIVGALVCCGPFAAIFSIIGLSNVNKAERLYKANPGAYTGYESVKTGKILSYIGLGLSLVTLIFFILYFGAIIALIGLEGNWNF
ncbi:CCC motif membrane protein [Lentiprolixibacter aurantiacus]|uniref:CCC motif membrane protein n=1 Tax=Lentiprolixibacter aurantiacus TaxID=2993939 RepID=A0AAE3MLT0_9FLAO|nr:CCC motif membrane protein [Lentiprolixibacter aurantiacus]MCX2720041.1 CCC motif membrane protein [Lentiprolixibacter aurantiacus]